MFHKMPIAKSGLTHVFELHSTSWPPGLSITKSPKDIILAVENISLGNIPVDVDRSETWQPAPSHADREPWHHPPPPPPPPPPTSCWHVHYIEWNVCSWSLSLQWERSALHSQTNFQKISGLCIEMTQYITLDYSTLHYIWRPSCHVELLSALSLLLIQDH